MEVDLEGMEAALQRPKPQKSGGQDGVAPILVQQLPMAVKEDLLKLLNASWLTGWCSQSWRNATICPIPKKGKNSTGDSEPPPDSAYSSH